MGLLNEKYASGAMFTAGASGANDVLLKSNCPVFSPSAMQSVHLMY